MFENLRKEHHHSGSLPLRQLFYNALQMLLLLVAMSIDTHGVQCGYMYSMTPLWCAGAAVLYTDTRCAGTSTPWPSCVVQVQLEEPIVVAKNIGTRCTLVHVLHDPLCCAGAVGGADGGCQVHRQPPADQRSQVGPATVRAGHLLRPTHHLPLWGGTCQVTNGLIKVFLEIYKVYRVNKKMSSWLLDGNELSDKTG